MSVSINAQADWNKTGNIYECTSGDCSLVCTASNECEDAVFIASHNAANAFIYCTGQSSCLNTEFLLSARGTNAISCSGTDSCKGAVINVGVPDSGVILAPVPASFAQSDFFGLINNFSLTCVVDLSCVDVSFTSFYDINEQDIDCSGSTDSCKGMNVNAQSTEGDISISCLELNSCNSVNFTSAAPTSSCIGDFCSPEVTIISNPIPTPDVDGDGILDVNDLCPTGESSITDVNNDGCDDGLETPDSDSDGVPNVVDGNTLEWTGPIFFGDFFDESNWEDDGIPAAADVINPSKVIGREILMDNFALNLPDDTDILLGEGNSLTINSGTMNAGINTNFYPVSNSGGGAASVVLQATSNFNFGLAWDIAFRIEGSSRITSANTDFSTDTGVLGKSTSVDFVGGKSRAIFSSISVSDANSMLSKFTVNGNPAVLDTNLIIKVNGNGSIVLPDFDGDGFGGPEDNCPNSLSIVSDFDSDGCDDSSEDQDDDGDGVQDNFDSCVTSDLSLSSDFDSDGCDDSDEDNDDDNDGKLDVNDMCLTADANISLDVDNDGCDDADEDTDDDNDGVLDEFDQCFTEDFNLSSDNDNDGCDDADEDNDDDNDGVLDSEDVYPLDSRKSVKSKKPDSGSLSYLIVLSSLFLRRRLFLRSI